MASHQPPSVKWKSTGIGYIRNSRRFAVERDGNKWELHHWCGSRKRKLIGRNYDTKANAQAAVVEYLSGHT